MDKFKTFLKGVFLSNRAYSLYWRAADMFVPAMADLALNEMQILDLPNAITVFIGLVLGEITKYLNTKSNGRPSI